MTAAKRFLHPSADLIIRELGEQIRNARKKQFLTQREMAKKSGIGRTIIQSMEMGRPGVGLAAYLQVLFALGLESQLINLSAANLLAKLSNDVP